MNSPKHVDGTLPESSASMPLPQAVQPETAVDATLPGAGGGLAPVNARYIWLMVFAQFGVFMAFITPLAISLTIRVNGLAPGHPEYLGYITGAGALFVMLTGPFMGIWSDRTRSPFGRRRPFMVGGVAIGVVSLVVMALAPSIVLLGFGWILAQWGWGTALGNLQNSTADRLPENQRGKVAGLTSFATQVAPVFGVIISQFFTADPLMLFLVPGAVGVVAVLAFVFLVHEDDSRGLPRESLTAAHLLGKYVYNPLKYKDFSWNWLARFLFYFGITLNTTYTAYFFADRLGITVEEVAGVIAMLGLGGVLAVTAGAIGGGFMSDKFKRRRLFVMLGGIIMATGMVTQAFAADLTVLIVGSLTASMGLGLFAAVDQALLLDVLPERETDAGRFMAITGFATSIPQSIAPLVASSILLVGVTGDDRNYQLLFIIAGVLVVLAGLAILRIRSVR